MLRLAALCLLAAPAVPAAALPKAEADALVAQVKEMGEAYVRSDAAPIVKHTHPALIALAGSPQRYEEAVRASFKSSAAMRVESCEVGRPSEPVLAGDQQIVLVPLTLTFARDKTRARSEGCILGIRKVGATEWFCLDGAGFAKRPETLAALFPGLPKDFKVPAAKVELLK
jgi:hypothetical protein